MPTRWQKLRRFLLRAMIYAGLPVIALLAWISSGAIGSGAKADCIFVPGAAIWRNRKPSDALEYRLQHALDLYKQGRAPVIVVAGGGQGNYAEAEVMAEWLIERGVPPTAIIKETTSNTTRENAESAAPMMARCGIKTALVSTQWFHVVRASLCLRQQGIETFNAPCGGNTLLKEPYFVAREMVALPVYWLRLDRLR
ncbi:MAG: YdcF family protein [Planctomycetes bacterium]|nr:YdcF family protein [Planctomycetota bacterium]